MSQQSHMKLLLAGALLTSAPLLATHQEDDALDDLHFNPPLHIVVIPDPLGQTANSKSIIPLNAPADAPILYVYDNGGGQIIINDLANNPLLPANGTGFQSP